MLYHLFDFLHSSYNVPGAGMFQYISFRAGFAMVLSLFISIVYGKHLIQFLKRKQIGESIRELGLTGQMEKKGTPTMGGIIIIVSILIPVLLLARLDNIYIWIMLLTTIWLGVMGFLDDYIKVFKKDKAGLKGKFKVMGQVGLGLMVGLLMCFHPDILTTRPIEQSNEVAYVQTVDVDGTVDTTSVHLSTAQRERVKSFTTTIPFVKGHELDYGKILTAIHPDLAPYSWIIFVLIVIFVVTAVSNGANLTDGIDGLATGTSAVIGATLGLFAWISGNVLFSDYLNIMYLPDVGELSVFIAAFVGATIGFLWYNTYPAQVFMGDTGSLTLGGIIGVFALLIRKELLLPILCGVFLMESLSVIIQVTYFKYTKKRTGEGKRVFLMSPLHHHYQKKEISEPKIVMRFIIVGVFLAVLSVVTLKIR